MNYTINCGIYKITNTVNGKMYIGSTNNLNRRRIDHFSRLRNNKHHSIYLQRAFDKYGEKSFVFEVIEYVSDKNKLIEIEQRYLDFYQVYDFDKGYNMSDFADKPLMKKGKDCPNYGKRGSENGKSVSVVQLDLNYSHIETFESAHLAQSKTGADASTIIKVCKGKNKSVKGFRWLYLKDYISGEYAKENHRSKRPIVQLSVDCKYINSFESISEAGRQLGINYKNIHYCCKNNNYTYKGYKWMYLEDYETEYLNII